MQKIAGAGATAQNTFTRGDPATGVPATEVTQEWLNTMQAELVYIVEQAGLTLDSLDDTQLKVAIDMMIAAQGAAVRPQSTAAQAKAGTNTTTDMSPARVKQAIAALGGMAGAAAELAAGRTNSAKRADGSWSSRVRLLPTDYALQTWADDLALGAYGVLLKVPQSGLPAGWWYIEVMRHINDIVANQFRYLRATPLNASLAARPVYHCSVVGGAWSAWTDMSGVPVGAAMPFFGGTVHAGFLKANGAVVSRKSYAALFAEIGTRYGVGDGSSTFNLPDSRGEFLRGWDDARGVDTGRVLGSWQADMFKSHTHDVHGYALTRPGNQKPWYNWLNPIRANNSPRTTATGGTETRPRNLAVQFLIKY